MKKLIVLSLALLLVSCASEDKEMVSGLRCSDNVIGLERHSDVIPEEVWFQVFKKQGC